jgi:hypothetical protein
MSNSVISTPEADPDQAECSDSGSVGGATTNHVTTPACITTLAANPTAVLVRTTPGIQHSIRGFPPFLMEP